MEPTMTPASDYGESDAQRIARQNAETQRKQAEKDATLDRPLFRSRAEAHAHLAGQMRGTGRLARKAKRRLAVAMVKNAIRAQKRRA